MRSHRRFLAPVMLPGLLTFAACTAPPKSGAPPATATHAASTPAPEGRLRGQVMRDGRPVPGMVVALYAPLPKETSIAHRHALAMAVADEQGHYAFREPVAPGEYVLELQDRTLRREFFEGSQRTWLAQQPLSVTRGNELPPVDFVLH